MDFIVQLLRFQSLPSTCHCVRPSQARQEQPSLQLTARQLQLCLPVFEDVYTLRQTPYLTFGVGAY